MEGQMQLTKVPAKSQRKRVRSTPEVRRRQLVEAGKQCIRQHGIGGFTVEKIAEAAGVSTGLISLYFDGRDGLLTAVYEHLLEAITRLKPCATSDFSESLAVVVGAIENNFRNEVYSRENSAVWLSLYAEMQFNEVLRARRAALARDYNAALADYLLIIAQQRSLPLDAPAVASNFVAYLDGLWLQWCLSDRNDTSAERASAYEFLEQYLGPLRSVSAGGDGAKVPGYRQSQD